jgi:succinate dehydrogenase / fumarate reductase flavoprotein subunit
VWVPKKAGDKRPADQIPEAERDYYLERKYPSFGNLVPRDIASRAAKRVRRGPRRRPDRPRRLPRLRDAIKRLGKDEDRRALRQPVRHVRAHHRREPLRAPMRIYPAVHYTMGGLWVDYNLMSTIPGLFVLGEANFSDHGANRLGASALMQGLADGYFVLPYTIGDYLAGQAQAGAEGRRPTTPSSRRGRGEVERAHRRLCWRQGQAHRRRFHRELGKIMWDKCGMARNEAGLRGAQARSPRCARSSGRRAVPAAATS